MAGRAIRLRKTGLQDRMRDMVLTDDLRADGSGDFVIARTSYGDYHGSICDRANHDWLVKNFPDVVTSWGGRWHQGVHAYVSRSVFNDYHFGDGTGDVFARVSEVLDIVAGLNDYPIISDESLSEAEEEVLYESWDGYYENEFGRALSDYLGERCAECVAWNASEYGSGVPQCPVDHSEFDADRAFEVFAEDASRTESSYRATEVVYRGELADVVRAYLARVGLPV